MIEPRAKPACDRWRELAEEERPEQASDEPAAHDKLARGLPKKRLPNNSQQ